MSNSKPNVSLTDFIDFAFKTGLSKRTSVENVFKRGEYNPSFDYWKQLRNGIVDFHEKGKNWKEKAILDSIFENTTDRKRSNYTERVLSYKKWIGRKNIVWFKPPWTIASTKHVGIRINPELGFIINGKPIVIKVFFKEFDKKTRKQQAGVILSLMEHTLRNKLDNHPQYSELRHIQLGLLDVMNGKLFESKSIVNKNYFDVALMELEAYGNIWKTFG